jgi:hypothetical protein
MSPTASPTAAHTLCSTLTPLRNSCDENALRQRHCPWPGLAQRGVRVDDNTPAAFDRSLCTQRSRPPRRPCVPAAVDDREQSLPSSAARRCKGWHRRRACMARCRAPPIVSTSQLSLRSPAAHPRCRVGAFSAWRAVRLSSRGNATLQGCRVKAW